MGGALPSEGRVEICFNNQFGTICDDHWDRRDAKVACGQLGFSKISKGRIKTKFEKRGPSCC